MPTIENIFRVQINYTAEDNAYEKISDKAFFFANKFNVELNASSGGPAWEAYFIAESDNLTDLEKFNKAICSYIGRFKNTKVW